MEYELIKKINLQNIKAEIGSVNLTEEEELAFGLQSIEIIKSFSQSSSPPSLTLVEYFIQNLEKIMKVSRGPLLEKKVSKYISTLANYLKSPEVKMFREMFLQNIHIQTAKILRNAFLEIINIHKDVYASKHKLLRNIKIDIKQALNISVEVLKKSRSVAHFAEEVSNYAVENQKNVSKINCDLFIFLLLKSQVTEEEHPPNFAPIEEKLGLQWDKNDPHAFELKIPKNYQFSTSETPKSFGNTDFSRADKKTQLNLETINEIHKNTQKIKNEYEETFTPNDLQNPQEKTHKKEVLNRVCHKYVFLPNQEEKEEPNSDQDLDKQIIFLKTKLEKQNLDLKIKKDFFKKCSDGCRSIVQGYQKMKTEIQATKNVTDLFLSQVEKNSDEWRDLYKIKNIDIEELERYKFFLAAILESASQKISNDFEKFKFSNEEDSEKMNEIFKNKEGFNLFNYLNTVYQPEKFKFDVAHGNTISLQDKISENVVDKESIVQKKTTHFNVKKIEEFSFPINESKIKGNYEEVNYNDQTRAKNVNNGHNHGFEQGEAKLREMKLNGKVYGPDETKQYEKDLKQQLIDLRYELVYNRDNKNEKSKDKKKVEKNEKVEKKRGEVKVQNANVQEIHRNKKGTMDIQMENIGAVTGSIEDVKSGGELAKADKNLLISNHQQMTTPGINVKPKGYKIMKF